MLTTAWDDTMTSHPDEIDAMEAEHRARRSQIPKFRVLNRLMFWYLDRVFFKGLRSGQTMTQARENAIDSFGIWKGSVVGFGMAICLVAIASFYWSAASTGDWISIIVNTGLAIIAFLVCSGYAVKAVRRIRKARHKES